MDLQRRLVRFALFFCPVEFRRENASDMESAALSSPRFLLECAEIALTGIAMRCEDVQRDISFAFRVLAKSPMYVTIVVATLALGIAANTAVASALEGVLFRSLPYPDAGRLASITEGFPPQGLSFPDARDLLRQNTTLERLGAAALDGKTITGAGVPLFVTGEDVDGGYFALLGAHPETGRLLSNADLGSRRVVISDALWRERFDGDPHVLNRQIRLNGLDYTPVGVAHAGFKDPADYGGTSTAFWIPVDTRSPDVADRSQKVMQVFGRLRRGVSFAQAQDDTARVMRNLAQRFPTAYAGGHSAAVSPLITALVGNTATALWMLYFAVALLFLIACANVISLSVVRALSRQYELAVRTALGAAQRRLASQLLTEAAILALFSTAVGILVGWLLLSAFGSLASTLIPRWSEVHIDVRVVAYVFLLMGVSLASAGLVPLFWQRKLALRSLKGGSRGTSSQGFSRLGPGLVSLEISLAVTVVVAASLIARSFILLLQIDTGFNTSDLYWMKFTGRLTSSTQTAAIVSRLDDISAAIHRIPGVVNAASSWQAPMRGASRFAIAVPGRSSGDLGAALNCVSPLYFSTMGIPILRGRPFGSDDNARSQAVAIVSKSLADRYYGTLEVLGRFIAVRTAGASGNLESRRIVAVVGDARTTLTAPPVPEVYVPQAQLPGYGDFVIKTDGSDRALARDVRRALLQVSSEIAVVDLQSYSAILFDNRRQSEALAALFGIIGVLSLLLALAGIFGVTAQGVARRRHEFGIRKAIGATERGVFGTVITATAKQIAVGLLLGFVLIAVISRFLAPMLYQTTPLDPMSIATAAALVAACAVSGAFVPAYRAMLQQPAEALRYE